MGMIMRDGIPYGGNSGSYSDTNVTQIQSSDNADYEVLLGGSADELTHTESAKKSNKLKVNPSTGDVSMTGDIKLTGTGNTWDGKNASIKSAFDVVQLTKTVTGNPIEFTDGASAPMVECVTEIQGFQDLHGQDKPYVGGAGKNKLPLTVDGIKALNTIQSWSGNTYTLNGITYTVMTDEDNNVTGIKATGTASANGGLNLFDNMPLNSDTGYVLNGCPENGSTDTYYLYIRTKEGYQSTAIDTGSGDSFTPEDGKTYAGLIPFRSGYACPSDGLMFYPMIRLSTESDSTFSPYSNICPITAYTEGEIEVRGKNLVNNSTNTVGLYDEYGNYNSDSNYRTSELIEVESNTQYPCSLYDTSDNSYVGKVVITEWSNPTTIIRQVADVDVITTSANAKYIRVRNYGANSALVKSDHYGYQVETGTAVTAYNPYVAPTTHTTTYPNSIYRGSEDVVNGTETHDMIVDDLGSYTWYKETWGTGVDFYITALQLIIKSPTNVDTPANLLCTNYVNVSRNVIYNSTTPCISVLPGGVLKIRDSRYDEYTVEDFKAAMSGVKLAYELATPTTTSVTPTNLPIKSLSGYNHIESSTGDMTIDYITEGYQPLVDLIHDENVTQTATTDNDDYRILLSGSATNTTETTGVNKNGYLTYNPNRNALTLGQRALNSTYGRCSLSLGTGNTVSAMDTVSLGAYNTVSAEKAFAQGDGHSVTADSASAMGKSLIANHMAQHVIGMCNVEDPSTASATERGNYVEIVGNGVYPSGSSIPTRSNARTLDWSGNEWIAGTLTQGSSRKIKKNISNLDSNEINKILQLNAVQFDYKQDESNDAKQRGFIAEDVAEILPCLVTNERVNSDGEMVSPASLNYIAIVPYLVEICKKQQKEIDGLKEEIARMK